MSYTDEFKSKFKEVFIQILEGNGGNIKATLSFINKQNGNRLRRSTLYTWIKEDAEFAEELDEIKQGWIDNIESAMTKSALEGNTTAQIFLLKTQAKDRGYIEGVEVTTRTIHIGFED
jgi:hypothetical protein